MFDTKSYEEFMNEIRHSNNPGNTEEQGWVKKIESWFLSSPIVGHLKCKKKKSFLYVIVYYILHRGEQSRTQKQVSIWVHFKLIYIL